MILPDTLLSSRGFKETSPLDQPPSCPNSILPLFLPTMTCISKLLCTAYGIPELQTVGVSLATSLMVVYFGSLMRST